MATNDKSTLDARDSTGGLATKATTTTVGIRVPQGTIMGETVPGGRSVDWGRTLPAFRSQVQDELAAQWGSMGGIRFDWHNAPEGSAPQVLIDGSPPTTDVQKNLASAVMAAIKDVLAADSFRAYS